MTKANKALKTYQANGTAIIIVIMFITIITSITTNTNYSETQFYKLALRGKIKFKVNLIAKSGINIARTLLISQASIVKIIVKIINIHKKKQSKIQTNLIWKSININKKFMKIISKNKYMQKVHIHGIKIFLNSKKFKQKYKKYTLHNTPNTSGLGFGSLFINKKEFFNNAIRVQINIIDEESKLLIKRWIRNNKKNKYKMAKKIYILLSLKEKSKQENSLIKKNINKWILISHIYNWMSRSDNKISILPINNRWGVELNANKHKKYKKKLTQKPKNIFLNSLQELNNIYNFHDKYIKKLNSNITIYGKQSKINILSTSYDIIKIIIQDCSIKTNNPTIYQKQKIKNIAKQWIAKRKDNNKIKETDFIMFLKSCNLKIKNKCINNLTINSKNFTIISNSAINNISETIITTLKITKEKERVYFYKNK